MKILPIADGEGDRREATVEGCSVPLCPSTTPLRVAVPLPTLRVGRIK